MTEAERQKSVVIDGEVKKFKLGHTQEELAGFRKSLSSKNSSTETISKVLGDSFTSYLNRADVRAALNIPSYVQGYSDCNDPMYETY
jgi:hypothetical protein